jgi:hypothetical protein
MCIDMVSVYFLGVCAVWGDLGGNWVSLLGCCGHVVGICWDEIDIPVVLLWH